jgi:lysine decarboxylase
VVSVHKMGAGFEQGSLFHVQGDLVDPSRLAACADLLMTTSPNVLIYPAMDDWCRQMAEEGLGSWMRIGRGPHVRRRIDGLPGLRVLEEDLLDAEASHDLDRLHDRAAASEMRDAGSKRPAQIGKGLKREAFQWMVP